MGVADDEEAVALDALSRHLEGLRPAPKRQVEREPVVAGLAAHTPRPHRVDDLKPEWAGPEPPLVALAGTPDAQIALLAVLPDDGEAVDVARVRVDAETGVHQHLAVSIVDLDDEPLRPSGVVHEHALVRVERLMQQQIIGLGQHRITPICLS